MGALHTTYVVHKSKRMYFNWCRCIDAMELVRLHADVNYWINEWTTRCDVDTAKRTLGDYV